MADPLTWAMIGSMAIGTGAQVYGSMAQSAAAQGQFNAEARMRELESKQADLQAKQISAMRMQELNANLGAIVAMRAGKNLLGDSPTGNAIIRSFTRESLGSRANEVLDARLRSLSAKNAMWAAQQSSKAAKTEGTINAIGALAEGIGGVIGQMPTRTSPTTTRTGVLKKRQPTTRSGTKVTGG
jgi:hypothetical protein